MTAYYQFLSGGIMMASLISAAFFFRFRKKSGDPLFLWFGFAFVIFAIERVALVIEHAREPQQHPLTYLIRLVGFLLILFAVLQKNRRVRSDLG